MSAKFVVAVAFIIERSGKILLLRRSPTKDHAPGTWETGSGRLETGENLEDAVLREVVEETGLRVEIIQPIATFRFLRGAAREEAVGVTFWCQYHAGEIVLSEEHDLFLWTSPAEASAMVSTSGEVAAIERIVGYLAQQ